MVLADNGRGAPSVKRQRTNSQSQSPPAGEPENPSGEQSEDETSARRTGRKDRTIRHQDSSRHHRAKSEKDDKDRQRQEAADKRKLRAEQRRLPGT